MITAVAMMLKYMVKTAATATRILACIPMTKQKHFVLGKGSNYKLAYCLKTKLCCFTIVFELKELS